jgi:DNA repair photolyase
MEDTYLKGKGAQIAPPNKFHQYHVDVSDPDVQQAPYRLQKPAVKVHYEYPRQIISVNKSPDLRLMNSINPYQGCEHGCIYCFARNSHEYWGFDAGLGFESNIIVKKEAPKRLEEAFLKPRYKVSPILLSGNTDCYQPLERKFEITRKLLKIFLKYRHPVSILTKNGLIERDLDLIQALAANRLVHVYFSITTLDKKLRWIMEPRTASTERKLKIIEKFSSHGIPVGVMNAPIIPGLNHHEIPAVLKSAAVAGATAAGYTVVRLNGALGKIFKDWLEKNFPDRVEKVWNQIEALHGGKVNDSEWGRRIVGEGKTARIIRDLFEVSRRKHFGNKEMPAYNLDDFRRGGNLSLF